MNLVKFVLSLTVAVVLRFSQWWFYANYCTFVRKLTTNAQTGSKMNTKRCESKTRLNGSQVILIRNSFVKNLD